MHPCTTSESCADYPRVVQIGGWAGGGGEGGVAHTGAGVLC
jgi:hypothetical protein